MKIVVTKILSLENPFLIRAVLGRLSMRLACKIIDTMELGLLREIDKVGDDTNGQ
jgi:hypothetical protein